jgi:MATE family multidrug resistance protein
MMVRLATRLEIRSIRPHLTPLAELAGPVVLAELGWMAMGVVDTLMVRHLGPAAIGAVGIGSTLYMAIGVFGIGVLLALDPLVAQAYGARRLDECHRWLWHGLAMALFLTMPLTLLGLSLPAALRTLGVHPEVLPLTESYLWIVNWSLLPLLLYGAARRYLQGMSVVRPIMLALISANLINAVANWVLVNGRLGLPALGVAGAAWATFASRVHMALVLFVAISMRDRRAPQRLRSTPRHLELSRLLRLLRLGLPAAGQLTLEVGVFGATTALAGKLAPISLATHQIALNLWGVSFMVPLGIASAASVLVGQAIGRDDPIGARDAGRTAILVGCLFMCGAAILFLAVPEVLVGAFTFDQAVITTGSRLLIVCSIFQVFDALQVLATGALRGLAETRSPMLWNLFGHWAVGLPLGYAFCFWLGWDVIGLWEWRARVAIATLAAPAGRRMA